MARGRRKRRFREPRRPRWRLWGTLLVLLIIGGLGVFSYQAGMDLARSEVERLEKEVTRLSAEVKSLKKRNAEARQTITDLKTEAAKWRKQVKALVPSPAAKALLNDIRALLDEGMDAQRMRAVLKSLAEPDRCEAPPVSKRFFVRTPLSKKVDDTVTFANGAITVTAAGQTATDETGNRQAWFDPAAPVTLRFTEPGGDTEEIAQALPVHHSLVRDNTEYRFSIVNDERRGYIRATMETCPLAG